MSRTGRTWCMALWIGLALLEGPVHAAAADAWSEPLFLGAHRGGRALWPENTVLAFTEAAKISPAILLEGDLRLTKDGAVVVIHDAAVDRTTNGSGLVPEQSLEQIKALDAGYHFTQDEGKTFPWRGKGITIPTLAEVLDAAPNHRFELELKEDPALVPAAVAIFREKKAAGRIILASFKPELMRALREQAPEVLTCFDSTSGMMLLNALRGAAWEAYTPADRMLSLPKRMMAQAALTAEEIAKLKAKGILVQVHTINSLEEIEAFRALGVSSILTDRPDLVKE
ncbi:MAG: hypothetical protein HYV27_17340 [Candidatus Hydrogenedentes bacterium]|nr:hypothetical protein [Candidatus Hydrogenedentota bacterium]